MERQRQSRSSGCRRHPAGGASSPAVIGRRQYALAAFAAVVLESGLLLGAAWWASANPAPAVAMPSAGAESLAEPDLAVTIVPVVPVAAVAAAAEKEVLQFVETSADQNQGKPARPTNLISDRSTQAAGEGGQDRVDKRPQPQVDGSNLPGFELASQDFRDGPDDAPADGTPPAPPAPPAPVPPTPPVPPAPPTITEATAKPRLDHPTPAEVALESIKPMIELPDSLPRLSAGRPAEQLPPRKDDRVTPDLSPRPPPGGGGGGDAGFKPQKIRRAMEGTIAQRGNASLDVEATPLGRYLQVVVRVVTRDWQRACRRNENLMHVQPGFLRVNFVVAPDGHVLRASAVEQRDAGETQKIFTLNAVKQADLPPIPQEIVEVLEGGKLEINFNFLFL